MILEKQNSRSVKISADMVRFFQRNVDSSGVIPQISLILGPCAGGAVLFSCMMDFYFDVSSYILHVSLGPDVVNQ